MPQIDWKPEFKRSTTQEFDRLKLKLNEKARIVLLEKPTFTWVHTLRAPKIIDGAANKVVKRRKDGTEYADWDMDFIGRPQCLGDHATIAEDGLDPKNCPVCARAKDSDETSAPERRFAINVIRYNTKADGTLVNPFGCSSLVWTFTENGFNKLLDIAQENGDILGRDLILGPCQPPEAFQKFDIATGAKSVWQDEDKKDIVLATHKNNRVEDLESACGRRVEAKWLRDDVEKIRNRWLVAHGAKATPVGSEKHEVASLKGELDNLLAPTPQDRPKLVERIDHPAAESTFADRQAPLTDEESREPAGGSEPTDFSKLLSDLNL